MPAPGQNRDPPAPFPQLGTTRGITSFSCKMHTLEFSAPFRRPRPRCYCLALSGCGSGGVGGERLVEVSARVNTRPDNDAAGVWGDVSTRLKETLSESTWSTWFAGVSPLGMDADAIEVSVPNEFARQWIEGHFATLVTAAVRDATGAPLDVRYRVDAPAAARDRADVGQVAGGDEAGGRSGPRRARPGRRAPAHRQVHLRPLRDRLVEPVRARRGARGGRGAGPGLQPAVHLRRDGPGENPPAAGDLPLPRDRDLRAARAVPHGRGLHERFHRPFAGQTSRRIQDAVPDVRRSADRRHPILRRERAHPGRVFPHLQQRVRGRRTDRPVVRPAAEGDQRPRGTAPFPVRVGPDHGRPAARSGDADRDPAQEGGARRHPAAGHQRPGRHRGAHPDEHPRARGRVHPRRRVRVAERRPGHGRPRPRRPRTTSSPRAPARSRPRRSRRSSPTPSTSRWPTSAAIAGRSRWSTPVSSPCTCAAS